MKIQKGEIVGLMQVIKRDGRKVDFEKIKIQNAIMGAVKDVKSDKASDFKRLAEAIADQVYFDLREDGIKEAKIDDIQDRVENGLMDARQYDIAKAYIKYRQKRDIIRRDDSIISLIEGKNEELYKENSNKNAKIISTMRDYIAGETCKDLAYRLFYPKDIVDADKKGLIHLHDRDYSPAMPMINCCLCNLEDMLQNGTVINDHLIEKPHSFRTATNIATQIIANITSVDYGGITIDLSHLSPFIDISRQKYKKKIKEEIHKGGASFLMSPSQEQEYINKTAEMRVKEEIKDSVQLLQYQLNTLNTTNGQSPFVSVFIYLDEVEEGQPRNDLIMFVKEMLKQRIEGIKNPDGVPVTISFPKILYTLEDDNDHETAPYWWLTKLAIKCTAKRLVPDFVSEAKMKELKEGNVFGPMGCRSFLQPYKDENGNYKFWGRFNQGRFMPLINASW